jgi:Predicted membrane protein (DUF2306)
MVKRIAKPFLLSVTIILSALIAIYAFQYLSFEKTNFLKDKATVLGANNLWLTAFYFHILFGGIALFFGGFQFSKTLRKKYMFLHRKIGVLYVVSVFLSSIAGFILALFANGGFFTQIGFGTLAISWFFSNYKAYATIRRGLIIEHQQWMTRNYALTFAAVTLRIWIPFLLIVFKLNFIEAYKIVAWLCWLPNIIVAEFLVRKYLQKVQFSDTVTNDSSVWKAAN